MMEINIVQKDEELDHNGKGLAYNRYTDKV